MKIYVASKGRPAAPLVQALIAGDAGARPWVVIVEPQDAAAYRLAGVEPIHLGILPEDDRGLSYVRQAIREDHLRRRSGGPWFWMLDDDVKSWHRQALVEGEKPRSVKGTMEEVLALAEAAIEQRGRKDESFAVSGLEYQQFCWSAKNEWREASYCDVVVAIHAERTRAVDFREETGLKTDRDFVMQLLASGAMSGRLSRLGFGAPKNGSNDGGLSPVYAINGREAADSARMCELWPDFCKPLTKRDGRRDVKINWRALRKSAEVTAPQPPDAAARSPACRHLPEGDARPGALDIVAEIEPEYGWMAPYRGKKVADVGGCFGAFAVVAAADGGVVRSYEPNPSNHRLLVKNLEPFPGAEAFNCAVTADGRSVQLYTSANSYPGSDCIMPKRGRTLTGSASSIAFSEILEWDPEILKIDCEGAEFELLPAELPASVRKLTVEFHLSRQAWRVAAVEIFDSLLAQSFESVGKSSPSKSAWNWTIQMSRELSPTEGASP